MSLCPLTIGSLTQKGFRAFKTCKETATRKVIWKCVRELDLEKENIEWPNLAIYMLYNTDLFTREARIMRNGNSIKVPQDYYISLVKKGDIGKYDWTIVIKDDSDTKNNILGDDFWDTILR